MLLLLLLYNCGVKNVNFTLHQNIVAIKVLFFEFTLV